MAAPRGDVAGGGAINSLSGPDLTHERSLALRYRRRAARKTPLPAFFVRGAEQLFWDYVPRFAINIALVDYRDGCRSLLRHQRL